MRVSEVINSKRVALTKPCPVCRCKSKSAVKPKPEPFNEPKPLKLS